VFGGAVAWTVARVLASVRQVFAVDGMVARKFPLAASAVWTLGLLGLVILISLLS
jgi:hypothetical protein